MVSPTSVVGPASGELENPKSNPLAIASGVISSSDCGWFSGPIERIVYIPKIL